MAQRAPVKKFKKRAFWLASNLLKDLDAEIQFQQENPKAFGSVSYQRYKSYCRATTVREALYWGAWRGDIRNDARLGFLTRSKAGSKKLPKTGKTRPRPRIMLGLHDDKTAYSAERFCWFLGIRAQRLKTIEDAQASLKAIDRVLESVQTRINKKTMAGKKASIEDFVKFVKAAVAEVQRASPEICTETWRYYAKNGKNRFSASSLRNLRKDPQISFGITEIRVLTDTMENTLRGWLKLTKAAGIKDVNDIMGVDGMDAGRRAADDLARKELAALKGGEHPSDAVVLKALRLWGFNKSTSRQNVMPEGHDWVHSDTLGIIEDRNTHNMMVSSPCKGQENFVRLLSSWARKRSPDGALPFTTIALNKNYAGRLHRDAGNIGPSVGIAIGPFKGGRLRYWAEDSKRGTRSANVETIRDEPNVALNIRKGVVFDGNCAHEVEPFQGERYSMIFFTVKKYKKTSDVVKRKMVSMGADWPTPASLKRLHASVPRSV